MAEGQALQVDEDFDFLLTFLPIGWEQQAKKLGALRRCRGIPNARVLLRLLLLHLAEGCSLRETAARAKQGGLSTVSDVTIMNRLRGAGEWFRWMGAGLMSQWVTPSPQRLFAGPWHVRVVDATEVKEPGPTGSCWRLHYAVSLPSLRCSELSLTPSEGAGQSESFTRFAVQEGDLFLGDRAYGLAGGIAHVVQRGGDTLTRFGWNNLPLWVGPEERFDLLAHLRTLQGTAAGDWPAFVWGEQGLLPGRVCALKRSRQATEEAQRRACRRAQKHGAQVEPETLEAAGYVFVFTTVSAQLLRATQALEFYRGRWQVELVFKRLKSILGLGHLHKSDEEAARSWLHGKLLVALLTEALLSYGEALSPWGYPLCEEAGPQPLLVAGAIAHAASPAGGRQSAAEPSGVSGQLGRDLL